MSAEEWDNSSFWTVTRLQLWQASLRYAIRMQQGWIDKPPDPSPGFDTSEGAGEDQGPDFNKRLWDLMQFTATKWGLERATELYDWCEKSLALLDGYAKRYNGGMMDSEREKEAQAALAQIQEKYEQLHAS